MQKEIISLQNPFVKHCTLLRKEKEYRSLHQKTLILGRKMVEELAPLNRFTEVLVQHGSSPPNVKRELLVTVTEEILKKISGLSKVEPVAAVISLPSFQDLQKKTRLVALDGISDPGNLGTLIRTAHSLGWDGLFMTSDSCDPFNDKALRAAKGATFHLPLAWGSLEDLKELMEGRVCIAADPRGDERLPVELTGKKSMLVLGSESHGLRKEIKEACLPLSIPMAPNAESLNVAVAGGILMYQLMKSAHGQV